VRALRPPQLQALTGHSHIDIYENCTLSPLIQFSYIYLFIYIWMWTGSMLTMYRRPLIQFSYTSM